MGCHGGKNGAKIHASKMPGLEGQLGGAISVYEASIKSPFIRRVKQ